MMLCSSQERSQQDSMDSARNQPHQSDTDESSEDDDGSWNELPESNTAVKSDQDDNNDNNVAAPTGILSHDVVCGRDRVSHAHDGNRRFRKVVEMHREEYQNAPSREEKTRITTRVVMMIRAGDPPGRFLKYDDDTGTYVDVGDKYAHEKVSHALRSAKDPNRPRPKRTRIVNKRELDDRETELCERVFAEQQKIYKTMIERADEAMQSEEFEQD